MRPLESVFDTGPAIRIQNPPPLPTPESYIEYVAPPPGGREDAVGADVPGVQVSRVLLVGGPTRIPKIQVGRAGRGAWGSRHGRGAREGWMKREGARRRDGEEGAETARPRQDDTSPSRRRESVREAARRRDNTAIRHTTPCTETKESLRHGGKRGLAARRPG